MPASRLPLAFLMALAPMGACTGNDPMEPMDASTMCGVDGDCEDGLFCNGAEECDPGNANANARGCVAGEPPCPAETCIEAEERCDTSGCADVDRDGFTDVACGGTDCDDADPGRHPGAPERCDFVDDDCDPSTVGDRDADGDGAVSSLCCNGARCGADCDDTQPGVGPTSPEVCNDIDDDCDGSTDEGVLEMAWPDGDRDGWGDEASSVELRCDLPSDRASRGGDCADLDPERNPDAIDVCDGIDQDCDGRIDEGSDALCDEALGPLTVGACVVPPDGSAPRCHGLHCVGGADVCASGSDNRCDVDLCTSRTDCGECGLRCLVCDTGRCAGLGASFEPLSWTARDALSGAPLAGVAIEPFASCDTLPYGFTDDTGSFVSELGYPEDAAAGGLRFVQLGYFTTLASAFNEGTTYMLSDSDYLAALAAAPTPILHDPELGIVVIRSGLRPVTDAVAGPIIAVRADGSVDDGSTGGDALYIVPNVLPGEYTFSPQPDGCDSPDPLCQRLDGVHVEGGRATSIEFVCESVTCAG